MFVLCPFFGTSNRYEETVRLCTRPCSPPLSPLLLPHPVPPVSTTWGWRFFVVCSVPSHPMLANLTRVVFFVGLAGVSSGGGGGNRQAMAPVVVLQDVHRGAHQEAVAYLRRISGEGYVQGEATAAVKNAFVVYVPLFVASWPLANAPTRCAAHSGLPCEKHVSRNYHLLV